MLRYLSKSTSSKDNFGALISAYRLLRENSKTLCRRGEPRCAACALGISVWKGIRPGQTFGRFATRQVALGLSHRLLAAARTLVPQQAYPFVRMGAGTWHPKQRKRLTGFRSKRNDKLMAAGVSEPVRE